MKKILLDMDGVIVDLVNGVCSKLNIPNPYVYGREDRWDFSVSLGIPHEEIWPQLGYDFWRDLSPYPWTQDLVDFLIKKVGADNISILTKPCGTIGCIDGKIEWLKTHVPQIKTYGISNEKGFYGSPDFLLIDDTDENVNSFSKNGATSFLFAAPWNRKFLITDPFQDLKDNLVI